MTFHLQPHPDRRIYARARQPAIRESAHVTLLTIGPDECRFPIGEPCGPETRFCGDGAAKGLPYCQAHARLAYNGLGGRKWARRTHLTEEQQKRLAALWPTAITDKELEERFGHHRAHLHRVARQQLHLPARRVARAEATRP